MPFDKNKKYLYCYPLRDAGLFSETPARFVEYEPTLPNTRKNTFYVYDPAKPKDGGRYVVVDDEGKNGLAYIKDAPMYTNWYKNADEDFYRVYVHDEKEDATQRSHRAEGLIASAFPMHVPSK